MCIFFHSYLPHYRAGMRLFITYPFPFTDDPMKSEYLAEGWSCLVRAYRRLCVSSNCRTAGLASRSACS
jgi:hypothetical protein